MKQHRIYIRDLPETVTQAEIEGAFSKYGQITEVDIKERKSGFQNNSLFFAYVNLQTDDKSLQKCFNDFRENEWHGHYVELQVAKESFLERLKRERLENTSNKVENLDLKPENVEIITRPHVTSLKAKINKLNKKKAKKKVESCSSSSEDSEDRQISTMVKEKAKKLPVELNGKKAKKKAETSSSSSEDSEDDQKSTMVKEKAKKLPATKIENANTEDDNLDMTIKCNKGKTVNRNQLKIEGVGKEPILKIEIKRPKTLDPHRSESDKKRLQSIVEMKKGYNSQKSAIKLALSNVDFKPSNKIVFNDDNEEIESAKSGFSNAIEKHQGKKRSLFEENDSEEENEDVNFAVREQFQGMAGQKLLALQSKFKNDKRFALDKRFLETEVEAEQPFLDDEELALEMEKKKEYEILEQVLGKKITPRDKGDQTRNERSMRRFDPNAPDHSKYELKKEVPNKTKRKRKDSASDVKKNEEIEEPLVSKEVFYNVTDNLKECLQEDGPGFSLLDMFGNAEEKEDDDQKVKDLPKTKDSSKNQFLSDKNPFRYDSTDDEDETGDQEVNQEKSVPENSQVEKKSTMVWSEPFFFKEDDYRLQEGLDFVKRIASQEICEFGELRRNLKVIVKNKVRSNTRKNDRFKKKLGGRKKKKQKRIQKALKR